MESTATALGGGTETERITAASFVLPFPSKLLAEGEGEMRSRDLLNSSASIGASLAQEPTDRAAGYAIADGEERKGYLSLLSLSLSTEAKWRRDDEGEKGYPGTLSIENMEN